MQRSGLHTVDKKLQECRRTILRTQWIDMQLMALHSATQRTTSVLRLTPKGTADNDYLEAQLDKITEFERQYATELIAAMELIVEVDGYLRQLPRRHEDVMRLRYIDGREWKEVANELNYSEAHCYTLHHEAVVMFREIERDK